MFQFFGSSPKVATPSRTRSTTQRENLLKKKAKHVSEMLERYQDLPDSQEIGRDHVVEIFGYAPRSIGYAIQSGFIPKESGWKDNRIGRPVRVWLLGDIRAWRYESAAEERRARK